MTPPGGSHLDIAFCGLLAIVLVVNAWAIRAQWSAKLKLAVHVLAPIASLAIFGARNIRANGFIHQAFKEEGVVGLAALR
jgi:hypothetical protein